MSKHWPWIALACLCAGMLVHAQTGGGIAPADDRKEPKTLTKIVGPDPTPQPAPDALDDGTGLQTETQYRATGPGSAKKTLDIKTKTLERTIGGVHIQGFYAMPAKTAVKGSILILPEWWGVTPAVKNEASWWAGEGYRVLVYDFFNGDKLPVNRGEAAQMMSQIKPDKTLPRLKTALALLAAPVDKTTTTQHKVGVIGLGMGTCWALRLAADQTSMTAAAIYYGEPPKDSETLKKINKPILGIFAEHDGLMTADKVDEFQKTLAEAKAPLQILTAPTHAGFLTNAIDDTDKVEIEKAHQKTKAFFENNLK